MAIVNTLEKCLDSPYLSRDAAAPGRVAGLLQLASDRLGASADLQAGPKPDPADVGTLAYEAMFAALRALVYARGYREAGLRCLLIACADLYVRPGTLEAGHLQAFERVQGLKVSPAEALEAASAFVARARELVGGDGLGPGPSSSPGLDLGLGRVVSG